MSVHRDYVIVGLALVVGLGLRGMPEAHKHRIAARSQTTLLTAGQRVFSRVMRAAKDGARSHFLLAQNVQLALDNVRLREAGLENHRLRRALGFRDRPGRPDLIPAEVTVRDPDQLYDTITINAGLDRGVRNDLPVVTAQGQLLGHVARVGEREARVQLIMRARVSAVIQESRTQGIVSWVRGNRFRLRYVEASEPDSLIRLGDRVISSGLGGRYPKGIPIGHVVEVREQVRDPLFTEVFLESSADFLGVEEVFVIASAAGPRATP